MRLEWLELKDFRGYETLWLEPTSGANVFIGENGTGKTNLLEAIAYLGSLTSFRGAAEEVLVRQGAPAAILRAEVHGLTHTTLVEIELPREGRRRAQVNRQALRRSADLLGYVRTVAFLPDDLDIVKGRPSRRRGVFDEAAVQLWPAAHLEQQEYARVLRQRNALLREHGDGVQPTALEVWDQRAARAGSRVFVRRAAAITALLPGAARAYESLAGEPARLAVRYISGWGGSLQAAGLGRWEERLREALERARPGDLERRVTTVGPHRDEPVLTLDGRETRWLASQGEQRCVALALRLGLYEAVREQLDDPPILLLDDVFSELDEKRAGALAQVVPGCQAFITSAREEVLPLTGRRRQVVGGTVR